MYNDSNIQMIFIWDVLLRLLIYNIWTKMSTSHASGGSSPFTISRFIIKEQIGSGTFGIVYRAIEKYSEK